MQFPFFCSDREYIIGRRIWQSDRSYYCVTKVCSKYNYCVYSCLEVHHIIVLTVEIEFWRNYVEGFNTLRILFFLMWTMQHQTVSLNLIFILAFGFPSPNYNKETLSFEKTITTLVQLTTAHNHKLWRGARKQGENPLYLLWSSF